MRKIITLLVLLSCFKNNRIIAQHWDSLGRGTDNAIYAMYSDSINDYLYVGGSFLRHAGGHQAYGIARWDGNIWSNMNTPLGTVCRSIARFNSNIYAAGQFYTGIPISYVVKWNGVSWDSIGRASNGGVVKLAVLENKLYALGGFWPFEGITSANNIMKWNDTAWSTVSDTIFDNSFEAIEEYNGELYVGGAFGNESAGTQNIVRWNGTHWNSVGGGMHGGMDDVVDFAVYNGELYVAGTFTIADGNVGNYIQKWNGINWSGVGGGVMGAGGSNGQIYKLLVYHNKLYAFGVFSTAGGIPAEYIASWDGTNWCGYGSTFENIICTGASFQDTLYIGGGFIAIDSDSINYVAKWIGGNYTAGCTYNGIDEIMNNEEVSIYPNPSTSVFTITSIDKIEEVRIYNVLGCEILKQVKNDQSASINIGSYSKGIYFVEIKTEKGIIRKKVVRE